MTLIIIWILGQMAITEIDIPEQCVNYDIIIAK